jgi:transcriptional regulator with XRE-family HTH domain
MDRNENFSNFLKDERKKRGKTQAEMAEACGTNQGSYYHWESKGKLPRNPNMQEKLAKQLGLSSREELVEKACASFHDQQNLLPIIRTIAKTKCDAVTLDDLMFLCDTQATLDRPMSPTLIEELMKHRIGPSAGGQDK